MLIRQFVQPGFYTKGLDNLSLESKQVSHFIFPLASCNQENFQSHSFWKFLALFLVVFELEVDDSGSTFGCEGLSRVFDVFQDSFTILGSWVLELAASHINEPNCKLMSPEYYF